MTAVAHCPSWWTLGEGHLVDPVDGSCCHSTDVGDLGISVSIAISATGEALGGPLILNDIEALSPASARRLAQELAQDLIAAAEMVEGLQAP